MEDIYMKCNRERLSGRIEQLAQFGGGPEGMNRFAYTQEEQQALAYLRTIFSELDLTVHEDSVGNIFARYEGRQPELKPILAGSHVDTVRSGGKYDGALGVLAMLEAIQTFKEHDLQLEHPIELLITKDEEGTRFNSTLFGSGAMAGKITAKDLQHVDQSGITLAAAMQELGYDPEQFQLARKNRGDFAAYLEVHIEQGKVLETSGTQIGIVTGIAGPAWLEVTVTGEAGHAGATPMGIRKDPMTAAAQLILDTNRIVRSYPHTVATTGQMNLKPGSTNVIPSHVIYTIDLRDVSIEDRNGAEAQIREAAGDIMKEYGVTVAFKDLVRVDPVPSSDQIMDVIEDSCRTLGLSSVRMPSGAGHDAMFLGEICPFGMIFVPSLHGYSHRPDEYTAPQDCANGVDVLIEAIRRLDQQLR